MFLSLWLLGASKLHILALMCMLLWYNTLLNIFFWYTLKFFRFSSYISLIFNLCLTNADAGMLGFGRFCCFYFLPLLDGKGTVRSALRKEGKIPGLCYIWVMSAFLCIINCLFPKFDLGIHHPLFPLRVKYFFIRRCSATS